MCHSACQPSESLHLGRLAQLLFEDLVLGQILDSPDGNLGLTRALPHRRDMHPNPYLSPAFGDIAFLDLVAVIAARKQVVEQSPSSLSIRRVRDIEDVEPAQFGVLVAEKAAEGCVALEPTPVLVDQQHPERRLVENGPHTRLTRLEGRFGLLSRADVPRYELHGGSSVESHRRGNDLYVELRPVELDVPFLDQRYGLSLTQHPGDPGGHQSLICGCDTLDDRVLRQLLEAVPAVQFDCGAVGEDKPSVLMNHNRVGQHLE